MAALINMTGHTYGDLTITSRAGSLPGNRIATWNADCACGNTAIVRGDYLRTGQTWNCGDRVRHPRLWHDTPAYSTIHGRLARNLGKATQHTCPCGQQAAVWAFTWCDEAIVSNGRAPYCAHACPDEYTAMCRTCAALMDQIVRDRLAEASVSPLSA